MRSPSYRIEDLASELQLPVTFTGHLDDPTDILSIADILVHCSVIAEPFGQVVVEGFVQAARSSPPSPAAPPKPLSRVYTDYWCGPATPAN